MHVVRGNQHRLAVVRQRGLAVKVPGLADAVEEITVWMDAVGRLVIGVPGREPVAIIVQPVGQVELRTRNAHLVGKSGLAGEEHAGLVVVLVLAALGMIAQRVLGTPPSSVRSRGITTSRFTVANTQIAIAAIMIGRSTQMRDTPAAISAVISLCR